MAVRKLRSRAFRRGLREGFAAPILFFYPTSFARAKAIDTSTKAAWKAVGEALKAGERQERERLEQTAGKEIRELAY